MELPIGWETNSINEKVAVCDWQQYLYAQG